MSPRAIACSAAVISALGLVPAGAQARPLARVLGIYSGTGHTLAPPTARRCLRLYGARCYRPGQLRTAYDVVPLWQRGIDGRGATIVIIDSFGSPTIASDLRTFDRTFGLADPPSLRVYEPAGTVPRFSRRSGAMIGWATETTVDVEWSHAFAPGANIVVLETPVDETFGTHGMPQMMAALRWALRRHIGDMFSMSFGAAEPTFPSKASIFGLRAAFVDASRQGVGLLSATGDSGATLPDRRLDLFPFRMTQWPASDPLVLATGGTRLTLDAFGHRLAPDVVWHDPFGAGGGGLSTVFARPAYQAGVAGIVGTHRGVPDLSMSASDEAGMDTYYSFMGHPSWAVISGTSVATVELAGLVAEADQLAGHAIGDLPAHIYELSPPAAAGIVDITSGNNSFGPFTNSDNRTHTVRGWFARPGYDLASGLGTVDAALFVPALAASR